jgi:ABC-type antimicrobial peptide transport system permease subunit
VIQHYFKIAWRNIKNNRFFSSINILGLSAGIAFTLLITAYVWSELRVNERLRNPGNQYILQSKWKDPNQGIELTTMGPMAKALKDNYPNLVANFYRWDGVTSNVSKGDKSFREGLQICDSTMLKMYGFELLYGDPATAFDGPFSLVITEGRAIKYFGKKDVVGQTLTIESFSGSKHDFIITGVMKMPPKNSVTTLNDNNDNQFYIPANNISYFGRNIETWANQYIVGYIELRDGVKPEDLNGPMQQQLKQNNPQVAAVMTPYLVSLKQYYLSANNGLIRKMLYALSAIALFILAMAIINFINMSVSRSSTRMREIGVRKVLGGLKKQLVLQFLAESVILVFFATLVSLVLYSITREWFSSIIEREIPSLGSFPFYFIAFPLLLVFTVGIIAGIYPAFILSSMKSVESLKGKLSSVKERILLRKSLVAFQFGTATIVFVGAIIISAQVKHFFSKNLGFNKDYILSAQLPRNWTREGVRMMETMRKQFAAMPQVNTVSLSFEVPDGGNSGSISLYKAGADSTTAITSGMLMTDEYYAGTYDIPMAAGIFYSQPGAFTDSSVVVINETQAKAFGWSADQAIGQQLKIPGFPGSTITVAGVTKDFHFGSMQKAIQPLTFLHVGIVNSFRVFSFKLKPGNMGETIAALQKQWSVLMPGTPFEYKFMDDTLRFLYKSEIQLKQASYIATVLSFIIVLLGVLGLVSLSIQRRTKEVGIRKVLGSSVRGIMGLFMKEFLVVILVGGIIACPLAYFLMNKWLSDYVYRIDITAIPFVIAILLLGFITAVLIVAQTIKTATENPVKSLRTE